MFDLLHVLRTYATEEKAVSSLRFFKTGEGQYGAGDVFIGVSVPECRTVAKQFTHLSLGEIKKHLASEIHEERFVALEILVMKYDASDAVGKKEIVDFYLDNLKYVNNWDLVDTSAPYIVGPYFVDKNADILLQLARSNSLWERRVAIVATYAFIKADEFDMTEKIVELLMKDTQDLIHKACGWMLREMGKRDSLQLEAFLKRHYRIMPRTMLRYAIERFPEETRKAYLAGKI